MSETASWITFGKDRYHQQHEITAWCKEYVGHGGWTLESYKTWNWTTNGKVWAMYGMFGNITYAFKEPKHLTLFMLKWS